MWTFPRALALLSVLPAALAAQTGPIPADMQIRLAVQAAPESMRADATVQGYDTNGRFVTLRKGDGPMICMAPNPEHERFEVSCHHRGLEPFFKRGRELIADGITGEDRTLTRWAEIDAGTLPLPSGTTNHVMTGSGFDRETGEILDPFTRYVVYMPGVTGADVGMAEQPKGAGMPWVMFPGTAGAHLMITPARDGG